MSLAESFQKRLSVEFVKNEIKKTVYGNRKTPIAHLDPRVLITWYVVFAIIPWFFFNRVILIGICLMLLGVALISRVSSLIIVFLAFGVASDIMSWVVASLLFGGNLTIFWSLTTLILKVLAVSLASISVFSSMEPDTLSDGLLAFGLPDQFAFALSYGYRMVPIFLEEYHNVFNAIRLRSRGPEKPGFLHFRRFAYLLSVLVKAFYPMVLNTAKRTRTTVEGLQIRGYTYAMHAPEVKKLKLSHLRITDRDILFVSITFMILMGIIQVGQYFLI